MSTWRPSFWQTPTRLPRRQAKLLGGLGLFVLILAANSVLVYEGPVRFLHGGALALVSLANVALAAGSLLPEERGGRVLRDASVPLAFLMLGALFASVAMLRDEIDLRILLIGALPVLAVSLVARLISRA